MCRPFNLNRYFCSYYRINLIVLKWYNYKLDTIVWKHAKKSKILVYPHRPHNLVKFQGGHGPLRPLDGSTPVYFTEWDFLMSIRWQYLQALQENAASPAELAKSYMGSRPSKISPSMLGSNNQAPREDATLINSASLTSKSPSMLHASKTAVPTGVHENGFINTRSRGRSAIYSMARSPYFRVPPAAQKVYFLSNKFRLRETSYLFVWF